MRRGPFAIAATISVVAAVFACTGSDPDIGGAPDPAGADAGPGTSDAGATTDDGAAADAGGDDGATAPKRQFPCHGAICSGEDVVCCRAADLDGGSCVPRGGCAMAFAKIECNDRADCPAGQYCCSRTWTEDPDAGGPPYHLGSACAASCGEAYVCSTLADCPEGFTGCVGTTADYIPTMTLCN